MKKLILNISDVDYERFCLEALEKRCDLQTVIKDRIFYSPFSEHVERELDKMIELGLNQLTVEATNGN